MQHGLNLSEEDAFVKFPAAFLHQLLANEKQCHPAKIGFYSEFKSRTLRNPSFPGTDLYSSTRSCILFSFDFKCFFCILIMLAPPVESKLRTPCASFVNLEVEFA